MLKQAPAPMSKNKPEPTDMRNVPRMAEPISAGMENPLTGSLRTCFRLVLLFGCVWLVGGVGGSVAVVCKAWFHGIQQARIFAVLFP